MIRVPDNNCGSTELLQSNRGLEIVLIDLNVAVQTEAEQCLIKGATGLREWSAPETRKSIHSDFRIDCWTLGCLMFFLSTGRHPFRHDDNLSKEFDFKQEF